MRFGRDDGAVSVYYVAPTYSEVYRVEVECLDVENVSSSTVYRLLSYLTISNEIDNGVQRCIEPRILFDMDLVNAGDVKCP